MLSNIKQYAFHWLPLIVYCVLIYIQSANPAPVKLPGFFPLDKIVHFGLYAIMGILFYRAYRTLPFKKRHQVLILLSVVSASLYGVGDEIHQYYVPYRQADLFDVIADVLGAVCGVYFYHFWLLRRISIFGFKRS
jgi:VanZ family protein